MNLLEPITETAPNPDRRAAFASLGPGFGPRSHRFESAERCIDMSALAGTLVSLNGRCASCLASSRAADGVWVVFQRPGPCQTSRVVHG